MCELEYIPTDELVEGQARGGGGGRHDGGARRRRLLPPTRGWDRALHADKLYFF